MKTQRKIMVLYTHSFGDYYFFPLTHDPFFFLTWIRKRHKSSQEHRTKNNVSTRASGQDCYPAPT